MRYKILQIPTEVVRNDENLSDLLFRHYEYYKENFKTWDELLRHYKVIYEDDFELKDFNSSDTRDSSELVTLEILELIFEKFNINHPEDYRGRSISTGDIVQLDDKMYMCDTFDWKELE